MEQLQEDNKQKTIVKTVVVGDLEFSLFDSVKIETYHLGTTNESGVWNAELEVETSGYAQVIEIDVVEERVKLQWYYSYEDLEGQTKKKKKKKKKKPQHFYMERNELVLSEITDWNPFEVLEEVIVVLPEYFVKSKIYERLQLEQVFFVKEEWMVIKDKVQKSKKLKERVPYFKNKRESLFWKGLITGRMKNELGSRGGGDSTMFFPITLLSFMSIFGELYDITKDEEDENFITIILNKEKALQFFGPVNKKNKIGWRYKKFANSTSWNEICFRKKTEEGDIVETPIVVNYQYKTEKLSIAYFVAYVIGVFDGKKIVE